MWPNPQETADLVTFTEFFVQCWNNFSSIRSTICHPVGIYLLKINNRNTRTRCEICSKLTITPLVSFWCLYCYLWTNFTPCSSVSIVNFECIIADFAVAIWLCFEFTLNLTFPVILCLLRSFFPLRFC